MLPGRRRGSGGRDPPDARATSTRCGEVKGARVCVDGCVVGLWKIRAG